MKGTFAIVLLCVAYACAAPKAANIAELEKLVAEQKAIIESMHKGIVENHDSITEDALSKYKSGKEGAKASINKIIDVAFEDINDRYEIALKKGKDFQECYDTAKTQLQDVLDNTFGILDVCFKGLKEEMVQPLEHISFAAQAAAELSAELDSIIPECQKSDAVEQCVNSKLEEIKSKIQQTQEYSEIVTDAAKDGLNKVIAEGRVCKIAVVNTAQSLVFGDTGIRSTAATCMWFAHEY